MSSTYSLGSEDPELVRLELQAEFLDGATRILLRSAGITAGMRVLDLGSGLGHVSRAVGDLVGSDGEVVGLDADPRMVEAASARTSASQVRFVQGDVLSFVDGEPFDAVVGRLILFHLADPAAALRHHATAVRPGGRMVALDFDIGAVRSEPEEPLTMHLRELVLTTFRAVGADPTVGVRLQRILADAGVGDIEGFAIQPYAAPGSPVGAHLIAGVVRTLAPAMVAQGRATEDELGVETLAERVQAALDAAGSDFLPPALVGAWGSTPA